MLLPQSSPKRQLSYVVLHMGNRPREVSMVRSSHCGLVAEPGSKPKPCCAVIPWGSALPSAGACEGEAHMRLSWFAYQKHLGSPVTGPTLCPAVEATKQGKSPHPKHRG